MAIIELKATRRKPGGSSVARRLRRGGSVPVVVYGRGSEALHMVVDGKELDHAIQHRAHMFRFDLGEGSEQVVLKDAAYDHLGDTLLHADFLRVRLDEPVEVPVAVDVQGHPKGLADGGVLEQHMAEVTVRCLPNLIPQVITLDVEELGLHEGFRLKDLVLPEGVELVGEPDAAVVSVVARYRVQAEAEETPEDGAQDGEGGGPSGEGEGAGSESKPSTS